MFNEWYAKDISRKVKNSHKLRGSAGIPLSSPPYGYIKDPSNHEKWIIEPEAAAVVRRIYKLCLEGYGIEQTARILQNDRVLKPMEYWKARGQKKPGKNRTEDPCRWSNSTVSKMLTTREYVGDIINFKTYAKSFKNKKRYVTPKEQLSIFEGVNEPIIERELWETVQKLRSGKTLRKPNDEEKNMFAGLLVCGDCGHTLHYHFNQKNHDIKYFNCSNYKGNRGTCEDTHYIRADAVENIVMRELRKLTKYLKKNEDEFAALLAQKTNDEYEIQRRISEDRCTQLTARNLEIDNLFKKLYEDNVNGKLTDERFMRMSKKYDEEQLSNKAEIELIKKRIFKDRRKMYSKEQFVKAVRKFMEMKKLTPVIVKELIEKIEVFQIEGTGKNRKQRIIIHYNFVGVFNTPDIKGIDNVALDARQGVRIEYIVGEVA